MLGDERLEICIARTPFCAIAAAIVTGLGIGMLMWFKHEFLSVTEKINEKFLGKDTCSARKGNVWLIYLAIGTGVFAVVVIVMGVLTNGDIRAQLFRHPFSRCIGMIICAVLLTIALALICCWLRLAEFYSRYYFFYLYTELDCKMYLSRGSLLADPCLNEIPGNILLDEEAPVRIDVCKPNDKFLCEDYIYRFKDTFLQLYISFCVIVVSVVFHSMCLAADFVKIRCQAKFEELEELRSLEMDLSSKEDYF